MLGAAAFLGFFFHGDSSPKMCGGTPLRGDRLGWSGTLALPLSTRRCRSYCGCSPLCDCKEGLSHFWLWGWWRRICLLQCRHQGCDVYSRSLDQGVGCRTRAMTGGANNYSSKFLFWEPSSLVSWSKRSMFSCCPHGMSSPSESSLKRSTWESPPSGSDLRSKVDPLFSC